MKQLEERSVNKTEQGFVDYNDMTPHQKIVLEKCRKGKATETVQQALQQGTLTQEMLAQYADTVASEGMGSIIHALAGLMEKRVNAVSDLIKEIIYEETAPEAKLKRTLQGVKANNFLVGKQDGLISFFAMTLDIAISNVPLSNKLFPQIENAFQEVASLQLFVQGARMKIDAQVKEESDLVHGEEAAKLISEAATDRGIDTSALSKTALNRAIELAKKAVKNNKDIATKEAARRELNELLKSAGIDPEQKD